ncbi:MAG: DegT/DnrJ/EryC1/StrS family aminotransferase [Bacteroidales bacterium]|nr:DegT/DnrJ/EryC1/StrS family aminotransferase [Bacteroidales bacterium]
MSKDLDHPVFVTQPFLPPIEEFIPYLQKIWGSHILTNNGPFHQQLEQELCEYLGIKYISLFSNGTLALVTALQALRITGEVITTPYSFVATTHALWWNNIKPVFVDIEPNTFNLDVDKIESAITPKTTAILPVHVYGNPCNVEKIKKIADTYGLKIIYDACHTFGVTINGIPILKFGDLSVMSFHATKVYNTFEGGAIICHDEVTKKRIDNLKNFGFVNETTVVTPGINGKMNEVQAAMGILQLKYLDRMIEKRKKIAERYRRGLNKIDGINFINDIIDVKHCYSYFPIFINNEGFGKNRDEVYEELKKKNIFGRRYFYPLISQFPTYKGLESAKTGKMPIAENITQQVLCLPMFSDLSEDNVDFICNVIKKMKK